MRNQAYLAIITAMLLIILGITAAVIVKPANALQPDWTWKVAPSDITNNRAMRDIYMEKLRDKVAGIIEEQAALEAEQAALEAAYYENYYEPQVYGTYAPTYVQGDPDGLNSFVGVVDGANDAMDWLIEHNIRCQFNQGLDLRLVNDENLSRLARLNYMGEYVFAFDDVRLMPFMDATIPLVKRHITKPWKVKMFVYVDAATMEPEDTVRRVEWLKAHECLPYVMRNANCYGSEHEKFYTDVAAWGNQPGIFKKMDFEEFLRKRHPKNAARQAESLATWNGETPTLCESCWQPTLDLFEFDENALCEECFTT